MTRGPASASRGSRARGARLYSVPPRLPGSSVMVSPSRHGSTRPPANVPSARDLRPVSPASMRGTPGPLRATCARAGRDVRAGISFTGGRRRHASPAVPPVGMRSRWRSAWRAPCIRTAPAPGPPTEPAALTAGQRVCGQAHPSPAPVRFAHVTGFAGELGVWVAAVQPLPQAVSNVVRLVRMTGDHRDHFLAQVHSLCHVPSIRHPVPDTRGERPGRTGTMLPIPSAIGSPNRTNGAPRPMHPPAGAPAPPSA
jgi:hypothetical protein